jgi:uncharacterized protein (DUF433 family)
MKQELAHNITVDPKVKFGKPIITGTRVPVDLIVGKIAGGMSIEEVMQEYDLKHEQVQAALKYAAELVSSEEISYI